MRTELDFRQTTIVYNDSAGISAKGMPPAKTILGALTRAFPDIPTVPFSDVLTNVDTIKDRDVWAIGGDGSITTLTKMMFINNPNHSLLALDSGTIGVVPKALGTGRPITENAASYAQRMIEAIHNDALEVVELPIGRIDWETEPTSWRSEPFLFMAGAGLPLATYATTTEAFRGKHSRLERIVKSAIAYAEKVREAPAFVVHTDGKSYPVADAHVIKLPFHHGGIFQSQYSNADVIYMIPNNHLPNRMTRLVLDAVMMGILGQPPRMGGMEFIPIDPNDNVIFEYGKTKPSGQADSQHRVDQLPDTITGSLRNPAPTFRMIRAKKK